MANKIYVIPPSTQRVYSKSETNITEKRAPTDESVKLLRKMEKAARKEVEKSIRVTDNTFDCNIVLAAEPWNDEYHIVTTYKLNGKVRKVSTRVRASQDKNELLQDIGKSVMNDVAKDISEEVLFNLSKCVADSLIIKYDHAQKKTS